MSIHPNSPPRRNTGREQEEATGNASHQARREEVFRQRWEREKRQREEEARTRQSRNGPDERGEVIENLLKDGDKALINWTLKAAASSYDDLLIQDDHSADDVVQTLFAALNRMRAERDTAISVIETLAAERTRVRAQTAAQSGPCDKIISLYRNVGLAHDCPDFLVKAAQLAFRKEFHPDVQPMDQRADAECRFKEAEATFEEIRRLRDR
jgi:hypothetical protein